MKNFLAATTLVLGLLFAPVILPPPLAVAQSTSDIVTGGFCDVNGEQLDATACEVKDKAGAQSTLGRVLSTITQILVFVVGGISVIVVVVGGLMYVLSTGESNNTRRAKDAILYAIIGLVVALVAQGLVSFVLRKI